MIHSSNMRSLAYLSAGNGCEPVEQIEAAAAAGLQGVGLRPVAPVGLSLAHQIVGDAAKIRGIRDATRRTGVRVLDCEVITLTAETRLADLIPVLATIGEIECRIVQVTCEDPDWNRGVDRFAGVCDEAQRFGIRCAYEFMRWRTVKTLEQAVKFVGDAGRPNGGIVLDTLHLSRSGGSPAAVAKVPPELLVYVQLCDAPALMPDTDEGLLKEARGGRLYPGQGTLWLRELFDVLPDNMPVSVEVPPPPSATSVKERAQLAANALDSWLAAYRASR